MICSCGVTGLDGTFLTAFVYVCGQFQLSQTWLRKIGAEINSNYNLEKELYEQCIKCIQHHQKIIEVADELQDLLSPIIFIQFVTSDLEICLSGYVISVDVNYMDLIKFSNYLISIMVQLIVWCWTGGILIEETSAKANLVFHDVPLYRLPKIIHFVVIRGQKYSRVTAVKFQRMDY